MLKLLRRYLRLMRSHDFSYHYSGDFSHWEGENSIRIKILMLKMALMSSPRGQWFIAKAEQRYGRT